MTTEVYRQAGTLVGRRAEDLLARMTCAEKLGQINMPFGFARSVPHSLDDAVRLVKGELEEGLGPVGGFFGLTGYTIPGSPAEQVELTAHLQRLAREETRLGIPLLQIAEGTHGLVARGATVFPEGPSLGSTWDPELVAEIFQAIAREARATGMHMLCTLVVEPIRDPRLGRNCQAFSEDPYLCREFAFAMVRGSQGPDLAGCDRAGAALTAYPGQSEPFGGLERGGMDMSERNLREAFLPPWTAVSGEDGALAVMASYAAIDGMPAHASVHWMSDVLREELDFSGIVLSEGWGFETMQYEGIVETQKEAGCLALRAGVDVSITWERAFTQSLIESIADGTIDEELLDRAVRRVLIAKFRLGLFDEPLPTGSSAVHVVHSDPHLDLALHAARESIVLLKNDENLLPLAKSIGRVAVIGPNADDGYNHLGDYVKEELAQPVGTIVDAVRAALDGGEVIYEEGCTITGTRDQGIDSAVKAADSADVTIVVLGECSAKAPDLATLKERASVGPAERASASRKPTVGEGFDVRSLDLSGRQEDLLRAVQSTGTPTVLVLVNGRALSISWAAANVPAIVESWLPGELGARAIADVLFGDHNPSGRLPVTIPDHVGQLPAYYNAKPSRDYWTTRGWTGTGGYVDGGAGPLFPFGHGLSYTTFQYSKLSVTPRRSSPGVVEIAVTVENVGLRAGTEVVQLYLRDRVSSVTTPLKQLRGFKKVRLEPNEEQRVSFFLDYPELAFLDGDGQLVVEAGLFDVMVGASCEDIRLADEFSIDETITLRGSIPLSGAGTHATGERR